MELYQLVKRLQTHSHSKYLKKHHLYLVILGSFCFTNHLIHNQVDYASSELHDSTQRKEIFPPTKTYCSFNKNFAGLLILMQNINKLYLSSMWYNGVPLKCLRYEYIKHLCNYTFKIRPHLPGQDRNDEWLRTNKSLLSVKRHTYYIDKFIAAFGAIR